MADLIIRFGWPNRALSPNARMDRRAAPTPREGAQ